MLGAKSGCWETVLSYSLQAHACVQCSNSSETMARYCYVVYGLEPGGVWVRLAAHFPTFAMARHFIFLFGLHQEYLEVVLVRTIRF